MNARPTIHDEIATARQRFEAAWATGTAPSIDAYLPTADHPGWLLTLCALVEIDLDMQWQRGARTGQPAATVDEYLWRFPALNVADLRGQLLEHEQRIRLRHSSAAANVQATDHADAPQDSQTLQSLGLPRDAQPDSLAVPAMPDIAGYEMIRLLGRGGMGMVYLARQTGLKRLVAIKMIRSGGNADADDRSRFRREAESIARLHHPNIIQIYEVGGNNERPYFSMEYAGGGTLADRLDGAPLPPRIAAELIRTLAYAMHYAHEHGIVHRDLKPANVLLTENVPAVVAAEPARTGPDQSLTARFGANVVPKITDFGLAKQLDVQDDLTKTGSVLGTPSYMAPEQATGRWQDIGPRADVYALGALLYECLTGRPPFRAATALETLEQVHHQEPVAPRQLQPKVPKDLETICLKCLEKQPRQRYALAADLADELTRFLHHEPIVARPVGRFEQAWRWCRRKPYQAGLGATVGVAVIVLIAGLFLWQRADFLRQRQIQSLRSQRDEETQRQLAMRLRTVEFNQQRGLAAASANYFASAEQFLLQAVQHAAADNALADVHVVVTAQHQRIGRVHHFYQMAQKAELLAFVEHEERAKQLCEDMLRQLDVLDGDIRWWERLPVQELTPQQTRKLQLDANHQLILLAALHMKHALLNVKGDDAKPAYRAALAALVRVRAFHEAQRLPPCVSAQMLENFCHYNLGQAKLVRNLGSAEPGTATDCYFFGIAYYWLLVSPPGRLIETVKWAFRIFGFDTSDPSSTAQRALRQSISQDPRHHWSYLWLGWALQAKHDYRESEMAFAACITLRPEDALGYAERARALGFQANARAAQKLDAKVEKAHRADLWQRCQADLKIASARAPNDWYIQLRRLETLALFDERSEALDAARATLELCPAPSRLAAVATSDSTALIGTVYAYLQRVWTPAPTDPEAQSILALNLLRYGNHVAAEQQATKALGCPTTHPRAAIIRATALNVLGQVALQQGSVAQALTAFKQALLLRPTSFQAALGRAAAHARAGDHHAALTACMHAASLAGNDWQHLEVHLERLAALLMLERLAEARAELEKIRASHPQIAETYQRYWFDE